MDLAYLFDRKTSTLVCRGAHLRGLPLVDRHHWLHDTLHDHMYDNNVECWKSYLLLRPNMLCDDYFITSRVSHNS